MSTGDGRAVEDQFPGNHCWGCGPLNEGGLHIKSYWVGDGCVCHWQPHPHHVAGPTAILNGGIIATIIDCHSICTAIAAAYRAEGRVIGTRPLLWHATARLDVTYRRPVPIDGPVLLCAQVLERTDRKAIVCCSLISGGEERVNAEVVAVRVSPQWSGETPAAGGRDSYPEQVIAAGGEIVQSTDPEAPEIYVLSRPGGYAW